MLLVEDEALRLIALEALWKTLHDNEILELKEDDTLSEIVVDDETLGVTEDA